jgi:hypothetical protein
MGEASIAGSPRERVGRIGLTLVIVVLMVWKPALWS